MQDITNTELCTAIEQLRIQTRAQLAVAMINEKYYSSLLLAGVKGGTIAQDAAVTQNQIRMSKKYLEHLDKMELQIKSGEVIDATVSEIKENQV